MSKIGKKTPKNTFFRVKMVDFSFFGKGNSGYLKPLHKRKRQVFLTRYSSCLFKTSKLPTLWISLPPPFLIQTLLPARKSLHYFAIALP